MTPEDIKTERDLVKVTAKKGEQYLANRAHVPHCVQPLLAS